MNKMRYKGWISALCLLLPFCAIAKGNPGLQLIPNRGQVTDQHGNFRPDIDAKVTSSGVTMFIGNAELHYQWMKETSPQPSPKEREALLSEYDNTLSPSGRAGEGSVTFYRMDVALLGANKNARPVFEEATGYTEHYYNDYSGEEGIHTHGYSRVIYKNVYPNIDWVIYVATSPVPSEGGERSETSPHSSLKERETAFYAFNTLSPSERAGEGSLLKYDFIVHPGGNPADIRLQYKGATELELENEMLKAATPFGSITEAAPVSYIQETGESVASAYQLAGGILSFVIQSATGRTLVIDPTLNWGTYFGGSAQETTGLRTLATDTAGNAVMCGRTKSTANIATTGAHQTTFGGGNWDGIVCKFNQQGALLWATYYGGIGDDRLEAITTDISANIYVCGRTSTQTSMATTGAYQATHGGGTKDTNDALIIKLDKNGTRQWATYYGDTSTESARSIACDTGGNIYVVVSVDSNASTTSNAYRPNYKLAYHTSYMAQFSPSGSRLYASWYPGGIGLVRVDRFNNYYLAGNTTLDTAIATAGTHQTTRSSPGNAGDAFIMKFSPNHTRIWGTYYGGKYGNNDALDGISDMAVDVQGNIYVVGGTNSNNGIATAGTFQPATQATSSNDGAGFIARFSNTGQRVWGSYYGGKSGDDFYSVVIGINGDIYTSSGHSVNIFGTYIPATADAYRQAKHGNQSMFTIWAPDGSRKYATYYGGHPLTGTYAYRVACNDSGKVYMSGGTGADTGIATTGAYQSTYGGSGDLFLIQFDVDTAVFIQEPFLDTFVCTTDTLYVPYGTNQSFNNNNTFKVQLSNSSGSFSSPTTLASISGTGAGEAACYIPASIGNGNGYRLRITASSPVDTSYINIYDIRISSYPQNVSSSTNSPLCSGDTLKLNSGSSTNGVVFSWTGSNSFSSGAEDTIIANTTVGATGSYYFSVNNAGCKVLDTLNVVVNQTPENVTANSNSTICTGDTMRLMGSSTTSGVTYQWTGANTYNQQNVAKPNAQLSDSGWYVLTATLGSCTDTAMVRMAVDKAAQGNVVPTPGSTICKGESVIFTAFLQNAGTNPQLQWRRNGIDIAGQTGTSFTNGNLSNGDAVSLYIIPNTACNSPRLSNVVTMTVNDVKTPSVQVAANPGVSLWPNQPVTFTATPTNGGANPSYQWLRNGNPVGGATGATWGANANFLNSGDDICVVLYSDYVCPEPDSALSNCLKMDIRLNVDDVAGGSKIKVYPNPVSNELHIEGIEAGTKIQLYDVIGREVISTKSDTEHYTIQTSQLATGNYLLQLTNGDGERVVYKVVKE